MKKNLTKCIVLLSLLSSSVLADDLYFKGNLGFGIASGDAIISGSTIDGIHEIDGTSSGAYGLALGYKISEGIRLEFEYISASSDLEQINTGSTSSTTTYIPANGISIDSSFTMLNIYKDWTNWYLGVGFGNGSTKISEGTIGTNNVSMSSGSSSGSAFGLYVGYKNDIDKKLFYDIGIKYLNQSGSASTNNGGTIVVDYEPSFIVGTIGIGYKF